jgi:DNA-binding transcriptional regulator YdaS (Cro superfamily)
MTPDKQTPKKTKPTGIDQAVTAAGGQAALGDAIGVTQQSIGKWTKRGFTPTDRAIQIEKKFKIPRETLMNPAVVKALRGIGK